MRLGVMVGVCDRDAMELPQCDFSELLLFDGDLGRLDRSVVDRLVRSIGWPVEFVHVQEFVAVDGREVMVDLSSEDPAARKASVETVAVTRELARMLGDARVVIHPGGIRPETVDHDSLLSNLSRSLRQLGREQLLLENMPWYYWYRKRERMVSNLCVSIEDMECMAGLVEGFALDLCHGYLSGPEGRPKYCQEFLERFGEVVRHVHASDAIPPDREGLQIGDGDVDFSVLRGLDVPVLVEVWNGHADGGRGFREGISRLRMVESSW